MSPAIVLEIECFLCNKIVHKINEPLAHFNKNNFCLTMNKRRLRTPNWSQTEKQYLLHLINVRRDVLLSRKNDGPHFSVEKEGAWNDILRMMIGEFGTKFTGSNLKKVKTQWQNMKRIAQLEANSFRKGDCITLFSNQSMEVCKILHMTPGIDYPCEIGQGDASMWTKSNAADCESSKTTSNIVDCDASVTCEGSNLDADPPEMDIWDDMSETSSSAKVVVEDDEDSVDEVINICEREENDLQIPNLKDVDVEEVPLDAALNHGNIAESAYSAEGKRLRLEILVEERRVIQAMREAAEINKIISEENLKRMIKPENLGLIEAFENNNIPSCSTGNANEYRKTEIPRECDYFYRQHFLQLEHLKDDLLSEISFHEHQIRHHQDAVRRHRQNILNINNLSASSK